MSGHWTVVADGPGDGDPACARLGFEVDVFEQTMMGLRSLVVLAACVVLSAVAQTDPVHLSFCDASNPNQLFYYYPGHSYIVLASNGYCLDVFYYGVCRVVP